jgi:hypothetical protein
LSIEPLVMLKIGEFSLHSRCSTYSGDALYTTYTILKPYQLGLIFLNASHPRNSSSLIYYPCIFHRPTWPQEGRSYAVERDASLSYSIYRIIASDRMGLACRLNFVFKSIHQQKKTLLVYAFTHTARPRKLGRVWREASGLPSQTPRYFSASPWRRVTLKHSSATT